MNKEDKVKTEDVAAEVDAKAKEIVAEAKTEKAVESKAVAAADSVSLSVKEFQTLVDAQKKAEAQSEELAKKLAAIEAERAKLEDDAVAQKAENVALTLKDKMVPAQQEAFVAQYITAAKDDKSNPIENYSRVDSLVAMWEGFNPHGLTTEQMEDEDTATLENKTTSEEQAERAMLADLAERAKTHAAKLNAKNHSAVN